MVGRQLVIRKQLKKKADMKMAEIAKQGTVLHATEKKFFLRKV